MDKTAIKNYAIWARINLIEAVKQKAYQYEIKKDNITDAGADVVSGKPLTKEEKEQRRQLIDQINHKGFDQVMEEVAYTWFNRFIALRFMEVNGYLPSKIRVFTDSEGNFKPEILKEALIVELPVDKARVMELLEKQDNEELYKMLLIAQCNELSNGLPDMFEVISNYTELLFPNNLLKEDSILGEMVNSIPEEDWTDAVQIIGWLYQYYNSELKDETFALLKKNVKISKERIPAATQLFTPDWIVRYMVENSLGRLWYEGHPNTEIKKEWKYYLDEAQQEPEVEKQLKEIREEYKTIKPEDITVIDPCMGSGHILVYAFDVLMQIYTSAGWSERNAAESILENNLYGLDIDDRAGQLAYFAVMMKARKYSRRILTKDIRPKVFAIQESNNVKFEAWWRLGPEEDIARRLIQDFTDAKEYGSILNLSVSTTELQALRKRLDDIEEMSTEGNLLDVIQSDEITRQLYPLVELAEVMVQKYDVVVTNPPYMGAQGMSGKLSDYVTNHYYEAKADLFSVMIEKCGELTKELGFSSLITQCVWMYKTVYKDFRNKMLRKQLFNMVHLGPNAFDEINGEIVQTTAFVFLNNEVKNYTSVVSDVVVYSSENEKREAFLNDANKFYCKQNRFPLVDESIYAYWISERVFNVLTQSDKAIDLARPKKGLTTGDNDQFVRLWFEISYVDKYDGCSPKKWYPMTKGGLFRKWYGNNDYLIDWENNGYRLKNFKDDRGKIRSVLRNTQYYLRECASWNDTSSGDITFRYQDSTFIPNASGPCIYPDIDNLKYFMGMFNCKVSRAFFKVIAPALKYEVGQVSRYPVILNLNYRNIVNDYVDSSICISKTDWDSYETSWDFKKNPLI